MTQLHAFQFNKGFTTHFSNSQNSKNWTHLTSRKVLLSNFDWPDTTLSPERQEEIEEILIEFHKIYARHRLDIGTKREFKVKLTPIDDRPAYGQNLPLTSINLKDGITVELALLHKYGIMTTLPFSKYASPIFAQRKPNNQTGDS